MSEHWERRVVWLAWSIGLICLGLAAVSLVLLALDWRAIGDPLSAQIPWFLDAVITAILGGLVASRRPWNPIGWLLLAISAGQSAFLLTDFLTIRALLAGASPAGWVAWAAWVNGWSGQLANVLLVVLVLFFPDGRLPGPRWRRFVQTGLAAGVAVTVVGWLDPISIALSPRLPSVRSPGVAALTGFSTGPEHGVVLILILFMTAAAVVVRLRRATGTERQQLRWFAYVALGGGVSVFVVSSAIGAANPSLGSDVGTADWALTIGVAVPLTIGLAVMRYRLYEIDVVISRTIVYGSLAIFITAVYVGIAVGIGSLVGSGGKPNLGLSILATAIVAVGFQPARERLQKVANRLVYGKRATPYEVLSQFSERVAESYASDDVLPRMARVLADGTNAALAEVWLRKGDALQRAAVFPLQPSVPDTVRLNGAAELVIPSADRSVVVRHQHEVLGALTVTKRRGEQITPIEIKLMDDLARQAGLVLKNVGLTADLQARLVDLRASRQRLVAAQDDERRRLERNLHDGAQQHLVAIKVKLGLAQMLATRDPEKARTAIAELKRDADEALETLRDLARGIYPPLLAEKGLPTALQAQARKATLPVTIEADGIGRYPQDTEAALYFCILEALQNIQKYAQASSATVSVGEDQGQLCVEVADDGCGFDVGTTIRGNGLTNMEDRLDALGGMLHIASSPGNGTTLRAAVPIVQVLSVKS